MPPKEEKPKKKRGRKPKPKTNNGVKPPPKKRGRKPNSLINTDTKIVLEHGIINCPGPKIPLLIILET